jgi:hypothetical protein
VKRKQKYIENLDMLKLKNSALGNNSPKVPLQKQHRIFTADMQRPIQNQKEQQRKQEDFTERHMEGLNFLCNFMF